MEKYISKYEGKYNIKYLRCDNAGENQVLKEICGKNGIDLEWTSPNTPQENGVVERGFAVIRQKAIAMMSTVNLDSETKQILWAEVVSTATLLSTYVVNKANEIESSYVSLFGKEPPHLDHLRTFGTVAYVAKRNTKSKFESRLLKCIMVGYAKNHAPDCYRFLNLATNKIIQSRDVIWTEELNFSEGGEENREVEEEENESDDSVFPSITYPEIKKSNENGTGNIENGEAISHVIKPAIDQLQSLYVTQKIKNYKASKGVITFQKAMQKPKWKEAVKNELESIKERNVWKEIDMKDIPSNTKVLGTKWVFKEKHINQGKNI